MKCKIGNGLKESLQVILWLVIGLGTLVPMFVGLFWTLGWVQLHLFELAINVNAPNEFSYYVNSGGAFFFTMLFIVFGVFLTIKFIYLLFYQPRTILNFFIKCD